MKAMAMAEEIKAEAEGDVEEECEDANNVKGVVVRGVELVLPAPKSGVIPLEPRSPTYIRAQICLHIQQAIS